VLGPEEGRRLAETQGWAARFLVVGESPGTDIAGESPTDTDSDRRHPERAGLSPRAPWTEVVTIAFSRLKRTESGDGAHVAEPAEAGKAAAAADPAEAGAETDVATPAESGDGADVAEPAEAGGR